MQGVVRLCIPTLWMHDNEHWVCVIIFNKFEYFMKEFRCGFAVLLWIPHALRKLFKFSQHIFWLRCVYVSCVSSVNLNLCLYKWFCQIVLSLLKMLAINVNYWHSCLCNLQCAHETQKQVFFESNSHSLDYIDWVWLANNANWTNRKERKWNVLHDCMEQHSHRNVVTLLF